LRDGPGILVRVKNLSIMASEGRGAEIIAIYFSIVQELETFVSSKFSLFCIDVKWWWIIRLQVHLKTVPVIRQAPTGYSVFRIF
jgi:hypothetical protein